MTFSGYKYLVPAMLGSSVSYLNVSRSAAVWSHSWLSYSERGRSEAGIAYYSVTYELLTGTV